MWKDFSSSRPRSPSASVSTSAPAYASALVSYKDRICLDANLTSFSLSPFYPPLFLLLSLPLQPGHAACVVCVVGFCRPLDTVSCLSLTKKAKERGERERSNVLYSTLIPDMGIGFPPPPPSLINHACSRICNSYMTPLLNRTPITGASAQHRIGARGGARGGDRGNDAKDGESEGGWILLRLQSLRVQIL